jgi:hypothetical protein
VASLADLGRKGAIRPLVALARETGPVTATEFAAASGLLHEAAKRLRQELAAAGLVEVRVLRRQGLIEVLEVELTPTGKEVACLLLKAEEALQRARPETG